VLRQEYTERPKRATGGLERGGAALDGNPYVRTATGSELPPPTDLFSNSNRQ
jgi:hypothetical protein